MKLYLVLLLLVSVYCDEQWDEPVFEKPTFSKQVKPVDVHVVSDVKAMVESKQDHYTEDPYKIKQPKDIEYDEVDDLRGNQYKKKQEQVIVRNDNILNDKKENSQQGQLVNADSLSFFDAGTKNAMDRAQKLLDEKTQKIKSQEDLLQLFKQAMELKQVLKVQNQEIVSNMFIDAQLLQLDMEAIAEERIALLKMEEEDSVIAINQNIQDLKQYQIDQSTSIIELLQSLQILTDRNTFKDTISSTQMEIPALVTYFQKNQQAYMGKNNDFVYENKESYIEKLSELNLYNCHFKGYQDELFNNYRNVNKINDLEEKQLNHLLFEVQHAREYEFPQIRLDEEFRTTTNLEKQSVQGIEPSLRQIVSQLISDIKFEQKLIPQAKNSDKKFLEIMKDVMKVDTVQQIVLTKTTVPSQEYVISQKPKSSNFEELKSKFDSEDSDSFEKLDDDEPVRKSIHFRQENIEKRKKLELQKLRRTFLKKRNNDVDLRFQQILRYKKHKFITPDRFQTLRFKEKYDKNTKKLYKKIKHQLLQRQHNQQMQMRAMKKAQINSQKKSQKTVKLHQNLANLKKPEEIIKEIQHNVIDNHQDKHVPIIQNLASANSTST